MNRGIKLLHVHAHLANAMFNELIEAVAVIALSFSASWLLRRKRKTPPSVNQEQQGARLVALELLHLYSVLKEIHRRGKQRRRGFLPVRLARCVSAPATI